MFAFAKRTALDRLLFESVMRPCRLFRTLHRFRGSSLHSVATLPAYGYVSRETTGYARTMEAQSLRRDSLAYVNQLAYMNRLS